MKRAASAAAANAMIEAGLQDYPPDLSDRLFTFYLKHGIESDDAFEEYLSQEYEAVDYRILAAAVNACLKEKYLGEIWLFSHIAHRRERQLSDNTYTTRPDSFFRQGGLARKKVGNYHRACCGRLAVRSWDALLSLISTAW
jgi:hypothetical protein